MTVNRSYKLKLYGNKTKTETALYANNRFLMFADCFIGKLYFNGNKRISTRGMGVVADRAHRKCYMAVKALNALKKTGVKTNVPYKPNLCMSVNIRKSKSGTFDYWVFVPNLWTKDKTVCLPAKSHKALNLALKTGWKMSAWCDLKIINGNQYAIVSVSKEKPETLKTNRVLGCDVGIKHSVIGSDGYLGFGLSGIIKRDKRRMAERRRQGHKVSSKVRTVVKQVLDKEAKIILRRSQNNLACIAVESPKRLANLRSGSLQGWARSYFANRLHVLGDENGVRVLDINPYQTSQTCSKCGAVDKESRVTRDAFCCTACKYTAHADKNAAVVIAQKGTQIIRMGTIFCRERRSNDNPQPKDPVEGK